MRRTGVIDRCYGEKAAGAATRKPRPECGRPAGERF